MKTSLEKVQILAPDCDAQALSQFLESRVDALEVPFANARIESVTELSRRILKHPELKKEPSCVALGYWLRKSNVEESQKSFDAARAQDNELEFVPVGRVFHITPANVDTLFVYSWALSYLCGNANLIRLSTKPSKIVDLLLSEIRQQMESDAALKNSNLFLSYEHNHEISEHFSSWCDHRIVWGGDETAKALRSIPMNPHASERVFASKFSYAAISTKSWLSANKAQKNKLVANFFNDAFWFGQMACSSPHIIFWVGDSSDWKSAVKEFEESLENEVQKRHHHSDASAAMKRLSFSFKLAAEANAQVRLHDGAFISAEHKNRELINKETCGGGLIRHVRVDDTQQIADFAGPQDQTVTHFGFSSDELHRLARELGAHGVDRVVPIGEALAFEVNWDGFNLTADFLRRVVVREGSIAR